MMRNVISRYYIPCKTISQVWGLCGMPCIIGDEYHDAEGDGGNVLKYWGITAFDCWDQGCGQSCVPYTSARSEGGCSCDSWHPSALLLKSVPVTESLVPTLPCPGIYKRSFVWYHGSLVPKHKPLPMERNTYMVSLPSYLVDGTLSSILSDCALLSGPGPSGVRWYPELLSQCYSAGQRMNASGPIPWLGFPFK